MQISTTLVEAAKLVDNFTIMGEDVEVFKDPTSAAEMLSVLAADRRRRPSFRVLITSKTLYYWDEWAEALHLHMRRKLPMTEKPLHAYIAINPATKKVYFSVAWTALGEPFVDMDDDDIIRYVKTVLLVQNPSLKAMGAVYDTGSYQMST